MPRLTPATYRRITAVALVALVGIIVTGAAVRLTGSGLGCSDWPTCEEGQLVAPLEFHPMVEFVNRTITGIVSVAVALAVLGSLRRDPRRRDLTWLSLGLVAGVIGQIVLGGLTVLFELAPPFVMGHFLLSLVLVANAVVLHHRAGVDGTEPVRVVEDHVWTKARLLIVGAWLAAVTGTVVTATGPHGGDEEAVRFGFDIETVARVHSLSVVAFVLTALVLIGATSSGGATPDLRRRTKELVLVSLAQAVVGWTQYFTDVPPLLVGVHVLGATLVWIAAWRVALACHVRPVEVDSPLPERVAAGAG